MEHVVTMLIERGSRPAQLTEMGRLFYEQAVQVLDRVEERWPRSSEQQVMLQ